MKRRSLLPVPLPVLTLTLLVLSCTESSCILYHANVLQHAQTPLANIADVATLSQCAVRCRGMTGCVQWARDPATGLCRLWPLHFAENPLTDTAEPLYQAVLSGGSVSDDSTTATTAVAATTTAAATTTTEAATTTTEAATTTTLAATTAAAPSEPASLPDGFVLSDDTTIAYRQRVFEMKADRDSLVTRCHLDHANAFPAVPKTEQQFSYLKVNLLTDHVGIGLWDDETEGVFKDMTGEVVVLPIHWWHDGRVEESTIHNCMKLVVDGLSSGRCSDWINGYICQYNVSD